MDASNGTNPLTLIDKIQSSSNNQHDSKKPLGSYMASESYNDYKRGPNKDGDH